MWYAYLPITFPYSVSDAIATTWVDFSSGFYYVGIKWRVHLKFWLGEKQGFQDIIPQKGAKHHSENNSVVNNQKQQAQSLYLHPTTAEIHFHTVKIILNNQLKNQVIVILTQ